MSKRKTQEQFEKDVFDRLGSDYILLSPYPGSHGKVEMEHLKCGNKFLKNVHDIMTKSSGCPYCNGSKPALYNEDWVKQHTPEKYKYIKGYSKMSEKCYFYCRECKKTFLQAPNRLINEHIFGCDCQPNKKWTNEFFLERLGQECLKDFDILEEYKDSEHPIKIKHKECNTIFEMSPYNFIYRHNKNYCPLCTYKKSKGELAILKFLKDNSIEYQKEFIFPTLPNRRFDFYLPEYNIIIEFDGIHHYKPIEYFGGEDKFVEYQKSDLEKNNYCINNQISLFRIPYWDFLEIPTILNEILKEKSSTTIEKYKITKQSRE